MPRYCWLPLLAFLGGSLIFIIVDVVCLLANHVIPHPGMNSFVRDVPR
ncbi:MAG TPA: hypothetical protein VFJ58_18380 [Armatimonadota bacterium]|nr:hypothetical protein [Armatimonadota bacterium]